MLVNLNVDYDIRENFSTSHVSMLKKIEEVKAKYKSFLQLALTISLEERNNLRSAYAAVRLAEMSLKVKKDGFKAENFEFQKFKEVCDALLGGFSGESSIVYLLNIFSFMIGNKFDEVGRFVLCVLIEILEKSLAVRNKKGTGLQYCPCVAEKIMKFQLKTNMAQYNLLDGCLTISSCLLNKRLCVYDPPSDKVNGKMLMQLFKDYQGNHIDLHKAQLRPKNYYQAKQLYEMSLKLFNEREEIAESRHFDDKIAFTGSIQSSFAAFEKTPQEKYRSFDSSTTLLEKCISNNPRGYRDPAMR